MKSTFDLIGRILIGIISIFEAMDSIVFFKQTKETMMAYNLEWADWAMNLVLGSSIFFLLLGGILVLLGYNARVGALLLLLYWLPYTFIVYSFWNDPSEIQRVQALDFMRMLAYCGALCLLIANGSGNYSIRRMIHVLRLPG